MSKVKIQGNASGTGTFTISAPNSNTDRSLTLPDGAGEILTDASTLSSSNLSGALPAIDGSALTGLSGGITDASQWRMSANHNVYNNDVIGSNGVWEAFDDGNYGTLGSAMTQSAGVFTFPSTGIWWIHYKSYSYKTNTNGAIGAEIQSTYNGGTNWDNASEDYVTNGSSGWYRHLQTDFIFDVTNTSTHKIRVVAKEDAGGLIVVGNTTTGTTTLTFFKLGDT